MTRVIFCHSLGPPTSDDPAEERSMLLALLGQNIKGIHLSCISQDSRSIKTGQTGQPCSDNIYFGDRSIHIEIA